VVTGEPLPELVTVGRILSVYGVKGWVKVFSHTDPKEQIFHYDPWYLLSAAGPQKVRLLQGKPQGKGLIACLEGVTDRNGALQMLVGKDVAVPQAVLPKSDGHTFFWRDLVGLRVINRKDEDLGTVVEMLETGANDVMRLVGDDRSIDGRERLLPWVLDEVVLEVDLVNALLRVDWDADF
jgi:16S rRNA processing protein RimM